MSKAPEHLSQQELESYLWGAANLLRGLIDAGDYKQYVFPLLFFKRLSDVWDEEYRIALSETTDAAYARSTADDRFAIPEGAHWADVRAASRDVGRALVNAFRTIEAANPKRLAGIFGNASWTDKAQMPDETLKNLIEHFSQHELGLTAVPEDELGNAYEYLIKQFADDSGHTAQEFYTNRTLVHLMTQMLEPRPGERIYDPAVGTGGMLISSLAEVKRRGGDVRTISLFGQELIHITAAIARMNLVLHGVEDFEIIAGNTLSEPAFIERDRLRTFDVVLANPPYSIKKWNREAWQNDSWGRNFLGTPPQGRADYAFFQHILKSLDPKAGRCAILFPHGVLFRNEESEMRRKLVELDLLECVLGLGSNLFYNSPMEACVVVCRTRKPAARQGRILDEAHRTQEGDLGRKMREALPNAFLFGLTGTPINRADRNTFYAFGAEEDKAGYMSRYGFEESIRDGATMPLHFEPRLLELHIDKEAIDQAFRELTGSLSDLDRDKLAQTAAKMAVLVKAPERIQRICADIATHYQEKVAPNGFGAQVVTFDRESCVRYKKALDEHLPPEMSDIVMTVNSGEDYYAAYRRDRDAEETLLDRFRDPADPLKILIVTSKLLTGFDAPILQLDKPLRDHTLLQAICRTNRPYGEAKTHGLIVDYLGVFDDVARAIQFDEEGITRVVKNINELSGRLPEAVQKCLAYFPGVDRTVTGYEGLMAAQACLPNNDVRDHYAADYSYLARLWEAISPDPVLSVHETDYRWLTHVYESVRPSTGTGRLLWHALGPKTIELIHEHVHVDAVRDDLETLVLDADLLEAVLGAPDPGKKAKEIEIKVSRWLRKRLHDPRFKELGERLEALKERHERGLLTSVEFLKELLNLARDVVSAERAAPPIEREEQGKAALTQLFEEARNPETPIIVERVVNDIDEIVRIIRFDGWQSTHAGEREVKLALRKTLFKYRLHQDQELFNRAYGYIREYY